MKNLLILISFLTSLLGANAQVAFGNMSAGQTSVNGLTSPVSSTMDGLSNLANYYQYNNNNGSYFGVDTNGNLYAKLSDGTLYGTSTGGYQYLYKTNGQSFVYSNGNCTITPVGGNTNAAFNVQVGNGGASLVVGTNTSQIFENTNGTISFSVPGGTNLFTFGANAGTASVDSSGTYRGPNFYVTGPVGAVSFQARSAGAPLLFELQNGYIVATGNAANSNLYVGMSLIATNGFASLATNIATISTSGWTNPANGVNMVILGCAGTGVNLYNSAGTLVGNYGTIAGQTIPVQPGGKVIGTAMSAVGIAAW